jgi:hypothetical protein
VKPLQVDGEDHQQNHGHAKGREAAEEEGGGQQHFVKAPLQIGRQCTKHVANRPAHQDRRQLQHQRPPERCTEHVRHGSGVLAEREAEVAPHHVAHIDKELLDHRFVGAEQLGVLLVDCLHAGRVAHALRLPRHNRSHRIARHHARQNEVEEERKDKGDRKPAELVEEVFSVAFQVNPSFGGSSVAGVWGMAGQGSTTPQGFNTSHARGDPPRREAPAATDRHKTTLLLD